jgi:hypothetical protein
LRGNLLPAAHFRCVLACRASALAVGIGVATAIVGSAPHRQRRLTRQGSTPPQRLHSSSFRYPTDLRCRSALELSAQRASRVRAVAHIDARGARRLDQSPARSRVTMISQQGAECQRGRPH